jgi:hypothetical protein
MAWFLLRGLWPAVPAEPRPYDLLLETPTCVRRLQVKTTASKASSDSWYVHVSRHAGGGDKHDQRVAYTEQEIDHFVILDGDLAMYLVPLAAVAGRTSICLSSYRVFIAGSAASLGLTFPMRAGGKIEPFYRLPHTSRTPDHCAATEPPPGPRERSSEPRAFAPPSQAAHPATSATPGGDRYVTSAGDELRRTTRWTAAELRTAAERATSWADMLRAFGFKPSSTKPRRALQQELNHFGIDTSHFVGQRTWSDAALVEAAPTVRTWSELCGLLGLSSTAGHYESVQAAARRLGVTLDHLTLGPKAGREAVEIEMPEQPTLGWLSTAAPTIATAWFLLRGVAVSVPAQPELYDLVVQLPDGLKKVQVKSTAFRERRGSWYVRVGHRPDGLPTAADFIPYDNDQVDLFFVVDGDLLLYLLPAATVEGKAALSLRSYAEFIVGDASSLLESRGPDWPTLSPPKAA